jgi:hypothetical protein
MSNTNNQQHSITKEPDSLTWQQKLMAAPGLPVEYWNLTEEAESQIKPTKTSWSW